MKKILGVVLLSVGLCGAVFANSENKHSHKKDNDHNHFYCVYKSEKYSVGSTMEQGKQLKECKVSNLSIGAMGSDIPVAQWENTQISAK